LTNSHSPSRTGRLLTVLVFAFALAFSTLASAQPRVVETLRAELGEVEGEVESAVAALREAESRHARALDRVEALRERGREAELREALADAHAAGEVVAARDSEARAARDRHAETTQALIDALRSERARLEQELRSGQTRDRGLVSALGAIEAEIAALSRPVAPHAPVPIAEILRGAPDDPEVAQGALAELSDAEARLEGQLEELRSQLRDAEASARVLEATRFFAREESLLDDDGFGRLGARGTARSSGSDGAEAGGSDSDSSGSRDDTGGVAAPDDGPMEGGPTDSPDFGAPTAEPGAEGDHGGVGGGEVSPPLSPSLGVVLTPGASGGHATSVSARPGLDPALGVVEDDGRRSRRRDPRDLRALEQRLQEELEEVRRQREQLVRLLETLD
jgi:hypothetical protein